MFRNYLEKFRVVLNYEIYQKTIARLNKLGVRSITFTGGGEPLTYPKFEDAVLDAQKLRFEVGLVTNGIDLDRYASLVPSFRFIRVSLDAVTESTYLKIKGQPLFRKVKKNIELILKNRKTTTIGISFVVCQENQHEIEKAKVLAKDLKVDYIQFKPAFRRNLNRIKETNKTIITKRYKVSSTLPCAIAGLVGIIGADANVYFCCQKRGEDKYRLGNLQTESFERIWARRNDVNPDIKECSTCRYMNYAKGYKKFSQDKYQFLRHKHFL